MVHKGSARGRNHAGKRSESRRKGGLEQRESATGESGRENSDGVAQEWADRREKVAADRRARLEGERRGDQRNERRQQEGDDRDCAKISRVEHRGEGKEG